MEAISVADSVQLFPTAPASPPCVRPAGVGTIRVLLPNSSLNSRQEGNGPPGLWPETGFVRWTRCSRGDPGLVYASYHRGAEQGGRAELLVQDPNHPVHVCRAQNAAGVMVASQK